MTDKCDKWDFSHQPKVRTSDDELAAENARLRTELDEAKRRQSVLEFQNRVLKAAEARAERAERALHNVEAWWLETGQHAFNGAPYCIFECRAVLDQKEMKEPPK